VRGTTGPKCGKLARADASVTKSVRLSGNGALLVRERAVAAAVQHALERVYQLDRVADVNAFVLPAGEGEREALLVREAEDGTVEMALRLPPLGKRELDLASDPDLDPLCQIIEGVSHFVYLSDRAGGGREATQLELELQAEVDKYVVLAGALGGIDERSSARLRSRLYDTVSFEHPEGSEMGERYRLANGLAARFVFGLEQRYLRSRRFGELRGELRRFYRMGQEEKLRLGWAA
jgi:hypothetical protein